MTAPLDVYFTVDVEVWCDGWSDLDGQFADAFRRYVYGPTPHGDRGLPLQLQLLNDHGLSGVFFVEPLFAARFGADPLAEIVGLIKQAGQDVQQHLHPEWVPEATAALLPGFTGPRRHLSRFTRQEQAALIATGRRLLESAGAGRIAAFRTGSFDFNTDTLKALSDNDIRVDFSYNASRFGPDSGLCKGQMLTDSFMADDVVEVPMTVFRDGLNKLRHAQLMSCSFAEMESLLWQALRRGQRSFVILSHNFETMNGTRTRPDPIVERRLRRLFRFLDRHRNEFQTRRLDQGYVPRVGTGQPLPFETSTWRTGVRWVEQVLRRRSA